MRVLDGRSPGHLCIANVGPVELPEPRMLFDVLPVVACPGASLRVGVEEAEDDVFCP